MKARSWREASEQLSIWGVTDQSQRMAEGTRKGLEGRREAPIRAYRE